MSLPACMKWLPQAALAKLGRIEFLAHGAVDGFVSGRHKSARMGSSVEFAEHRQYTRGDDLRNIDWKLVARRQRFYVKQYTGETNLRATVVLDTSGSMAYHGGSAHEGLSKLDYGKYLAALITYLLVNQQDACGFVSFDTEVRDFVPAKSSAGQVRTVLEKIDAISPGGETGLAEVLHEVAERIPRRSVVFLISDFFDDSAELVKALHHLRFRNHEVIALRLADHDEVEFPFAQLKKFEDLEGTEILDVDARAVRSGYIERFRRHVDEIKRGCGEMRIVHEFLDTSVPYDRALADVLVRYRQTGGAR